ncbi:MAG: hypothetical protein N3A01_01810 [Bacteroidales bacterium]|nr:hypothetical protein [Bacteroidales bacterium]
MKSKVIIGVFIFYVIIFHFRCRKDEKENFKETFNFKKGFYIVNEGNFTWGNSSISFYDEVKREVENDVFYRANKIPLGDVGMDLKIIDTNCYIVVNNSGLIQITDPFTMKYKASIKNLVSPRYIVPIDKNTIWVSDLYNKCIYVINTKNNTIASTINTPRCIEAMIKLNNKVYATSWSFNNKVYVFDTNTKLLIDSITVGLQPNSIVSDKDSNIWVLCDGGYEGNPIGHEFPTLHKIDSKNNKILKTFILKDKSASARSLCINPSCDSIYFINKHIYKISIYDTVVPNSFFINGESKNFYSLNIHPNNKYIVVTDAKDYVTNGEILIYNNNRQLIDKKIVGIIPRTITFINF